MTESLSSLFGALEEPVIAVSAGEIIYRNSAAELLLPEDSILRELLPSAVYDRVPEGPPIELSVNGMRYYISGSLMSDAKVLIFANNSTHSLRDSEILTSALIALRNPATTLRAAADSLMPILQSSPDEKHSELAAIQTRSVYGLLRAINRIEAFNYMYGSGVLPIRPQEFDLLTSCAELVSSVSTMTGCDEKRLCFTKRPGEVVINGDKTLIDRMLLCLIDNAMRYSGPGAQIAVGAKIVGNHAVITVRDNGAGLGELSIDDYWERYRTWSDKEASLAARGAGLGMTIVRAVAQLHHGNVMLQTSAEEPGLGIIIAIPLVRKPKYLYDAVTSEDGINAAMEELFTELTDLIPLERYHYKYMD